MLGDSAFSARPHTGMGVVKATGDANSLARAIEVHPGDLAGALSAYDEERTRLRPLPGPLRPPPGPRISRPRSGAPRIAPFGDYLREPLTVIQAISIPPPCSPLAAFRDDPEIVCERR